MTESEKRSAKVIGENIAFHRKKRGLTQKQLADMIGVNRMTIARYEQGLYSPKSAQVESIAEALDVSPLFLTYDAETLSVLIDYAQTQANELVNRLKSSVQRLNSKGISKVIEYAELLSTQAEYTSADAEE